MKISILLNQHREFMLRCLCLTGIKVITNLSNQNGLLKLSGIDLGEQEVKEIHLLGEGYDGIYDQINKVGFALKAKIGNWLIFVPKDEILNGIQFSGVFQSGDIVLVNGERYSGQKALIFVANSEMEYFVLITDLGEIFEIQGIKNVFERLIFLDKSNIKLSGKGSTIHTMFISGLLKEVFE